MLAHVGQEIEVGVEQMLLAVTSAVASFSVCF